MSLLGALKFLLIGIGELNFSYGIVIHLLKSEEFFVSRTSNTG